MTFTPALRFYCFTNFYLSSIQHGIQTGHCAVDLVVKYMAGRGNPNVDKDHVNMVADWATNHKTFITLNGGELTNMSGPVLQAVMNSGLPWCTFHEDAGLANMLTAVGVVVPETMFDAVECDEMYAPDHSGIMMMTGKKAYRYINPEYGIDKMYGPSNTPTEFAFLSILKRCRLAQ